MNALKNWWCSPRKSSSSMGRHIIWL